MKTSIEFMEDVKALYCLPSDYALAKKIGLSQQAVGKYRKFGTSFDDTTALRVASLLKIEPAVVVASAHAQRAKTPEEKTVWATIYQRLSGFPDLRTSANDGADAVRP